MWMQTLAVLMAKTISRSNLELEKKKKKTTKKVDITQYPT